MNQTIIRLAAGMTLYRLELLVDGGGTAHSIAQQLACAAEAADVFLTPTQFDGAVDLIAQKLEKSSIRLKKR